MPGRWYLIWVLILVISKPTRGQEIQEEQLLIEGRQVYLAYPSGVVKGKMPVLMAIHGSGREAASYIPGDEKGNAFYQHQRDLAVNGCYLFVVISNGSATWGTEKGMAVLQSVYNYIASKFSVDKKWVLWGTSAGGVLMNRMVKTYPERVRKVIGTFPVYDLEESFGHLVSARPAWSSEEEAKKVNPALDPQALAKVPYLLIHGREDKAVPSEAHSERLANEVNRAGGKVELHLVDGGHSTENWNLYPDEIIKAFLKN
jgi:pimeloyl-ACP methyl ester carboxylesterase